MTQTIVAIDLETTGLDARNDAIIEIGAVKFKGDRIEGEYSTLVNPGRAIPANITHLTGISDAMVANAPKAAEVLPKLAAFVGEATVLGHNVRFDLGFLQARGLLKYNDMADTYNLAAALLPSAGRYNLGALAKELGILLPATHRALDDCRVTVAVYQALAEKALVLPLDVLAEITNLSRDVEWAAGHFFEDALRARSKEMASGRRAASLPGLFGPAEREPRPLIPAEVSTPLAADELAGVLEPGGAFAAHFPNYEFRSEQVAMLRAVAHAFSQGRHLMVEAGTGTGKCLHGETWVTFESGARRQIQDIVSDPELTTERVLSIDQSGRLIYQRIAAVHRNGVRPVWQLRTGLGRKIIATANHPFLGFNGWQPLETLKVGDRIATIRRLPAGRQAHPAHEAFVAGAMLGDGVCGHLGAVQFVNFDPAVVEAIRVNVARLENVRLTETKVPGHYGFQRLSLMGHERNGLHVLLDRLGILGRTARHKHIPAAYFEAEADTLSHLLAGLWVTDGSIETRDGHPTYSSASERLVAEIQHLLLRLGIVSRVRYKSASLNGKRFDSWRLTISDLDSKRRFQRTVGRHMLGRRRERLDRWHASHLQSKANFNDDLLPLAAWNLVDEARQHRAISWYAIRQKCVVASDRTRELSRAKMEQIGAYLEAPALVATATSDLYWDRIVAIESVGLSETFDLTMDGEPNFVANDIVAHNSIAYLIPAVQWALQNGERVVVSTNTLNLQDQLVNKDIPDLRAALGLDFRAALLKGRGNYLCPRRLENLRRHRPKSAEEMRVLAKLLVWLSEPEATRRPLSLGPIDRGGWARLSAEDDACTLDMCRERMKGLCPFYQARKAAEAAHVVIVNHALLLADIATENRVLPAYKYLILDEAHHLETATTDGLSFELNQPDFERQLKDLGGPNSGLLGEVLGAARAALLMERYIPLEVEVTAVYDKTSAALTLARAFFESVAAFLEDRRDGRPINDYGQTVRIVAATRTLPQWSQVELQWDQLRPTLNVLADALTRIAQALAKWARDPEIEFDQAEDLASATAQMARYFAVVVQNGDGLVARPDPNQIYWAEAGGRDGRVSLHAAPLHVGALVEKHLWNAKESVVLTSATLTAGAEFDYLKSRLNARDVDELAVGSPFNYEASTLLYLATDMPEPVVKQEYQKALEKSLIELCKATRGRALVLFTSYAQLKQTAGAIRGPLQRVGIDVYDQSDGTSRTMLLDNFKASEGGVLLGTKSFWEGVDVPGDALSVLVITRLPFDVPDDPIVAARSETFERAFDEYSVPEAVLKFRQGFGRLIRTKTDRGVVVVLDRRILSKAYGRTFLDSLPHCTIRRAPLAQLAKDAAQWLGV